MQSVRTIILVFISVLTRVTAMAQDGTVNIWQDVPHHKKVEMTPYIADGTGNIAIVVCPGGSYFWHDMKHEGHEVGEWLKENGISAFVLRYRTAYVPAFVTRFRYIFRGNRYPDPQEDLFQAMRYIKANAEEYVIDTLRIGAIGFSAGGHLAMSAGELFPTSERPAFIASIYPVVTMTEDCVHRRSRRALLGDSRKRNQKLRDSLSLERHVTSDCPPVFLVNCIDDPIVDYHNSMLLDSALTAKGVRHIYLQYETGGHGFGASEIKGTDECRRWKTEFLHWLKKQFIDEPDR